MAGSARVDSGRAVALHKRYASDGTPGGLVLAQFLNELVPNPALYLQLFRFVVVFLAGVVLTMEELRTYAINGRTKSAIRLNWPNENIDEAMTLLSTLANEREDVLDEPAPPIFFTDSAGDIVTEPHYWVETPDTVKETKSELLAAFNREASARGLFEPTDPDPE